MLTARKLMKIEPTIKMASDYAKRKHRETNHKYDDVYPYEIHLWDVYEYAVKYRELLSNDYNEDLIINALAAAWVHDTMEDTRETYNDVKKATNKTIADIAYALTNHKGKTRSERAGKAYYKGIKNEPLADYIKICDRLANIRYSSTTQSRMIDVYRKEHDHFKNMLYKPEYSIMFKEMEMLLEEQSETEIYYARKQADRDKFLQQNLKLYVGFGIITTLLAIFCYFYY